MHVDLLQHKNEIHLMLSTISNKQLP